MHYKLKDFIAELERITARETEPEAITAQAAPLLARLITSPDAIPRAFRQRPPDGRRGRYMLHRAPSFNVTSVVWAPGETAHAHNHDTWGLFGVVENEMQETRYRVVSGRNPEVKAIVHHGRGAVSCLVPPHDDIHAMHNPTGRDTVEIHVYGRDLVGLERKTWSADGAERPLVNPKYLNC